MEHLLKLADEYQTRGIVDVCVKMLKSEAQSKDNAVKILHLATCTPTIREDEKLILVREQCFELIKNMELSEAQGKESYENLEKDVLERVLVKRIQRLETFVKEIYPQFMGLVECCLWSVSGNAEVISTCPQHFSNKRPKENLLMLVKGCPVCRQMIKQLVHYFKTPQLLQQSLHPPHPPHPSHPLPQRQPVRGFPSTLGSTVPFVLAAPAPNAYEYGGSYHFDEEVITIIQDFEKLFRI